MSASQWRSRTELEIVIAVLLALHDTPAGLAAALVLPGMRAFLLGFPACGLVTPWTGD